MKYLLYLFIIIACLLTSCKKNYNCSCTATGAATITWITVIHDTKAKAKTSCDAMNSTSAYSTTKCFIQ